MRKTVVRSVLVALSLAVTAARAENFSKTYEFKPNMALQVGSEVREGLRLDTIEFVIPKNDPAEASTFGGPKVKVTVSNVGKTSQTIAVAIAVTDADGKLVGVASGGTKIFPLRAERQMTYTLDFGAVNSELANGKEFKFTIEPKP